MATFINTKYDINALSNSVRAECQTKHPWIKGAQAFVNVIQTPEDEVVLTNIQFRYAGGEKITLEPHKLVFYSTFGYSVSLCHFDSFDKFVEGEIY